MVVLAPVIGDVVLYVLPNGPHIGEPRSGLVVRLTKDPRRPVIRVFTSSDDGVQFARFGVEVVASWNPKHEHGTWDYPGPSWGFPMDRMDDGGLTIMGPPEEP